MTAVQTEPATRPARLSTKQKVGTVLTGLFALTNVPSILFTTPDGETGPPTGILLVDTLLGLLGVVGAVMAWRGSRLGMRLAVGANLLICLTALPAFFVDVSMAIKALTALGLVVAVVAAVLMFSGTRRSEV